MTKNEKTEGDNVGKSIPSKMRKKKRHYFLNFTLKEKIFRIGVNILLNQFLKHRLRRYCMKVPGIVFLKYECAYESLGHPVKIPILLCERMVMVANAMVIII